MKLLIVLALLLAVTSAQFSRSRGSRRGGGRFRLDSDEFFDDDDDDFDDFDDDRFDRDSLEDIYDDLFDDDADDRRRAQAALSRLRAGGGNTGQFRNNFGSQRTNNINRFSGGNSGFRSSNSRFQNRNSGFSSSSNRFGQQQQSNRFTNRFNSNTNSNRFNSNSNRFSNNNRFSSIASQRQRPITSQFNSINSASRTNPFRSSFGNARTTTNAFNNRGSSSSRPRSTTGNTGFRSSLGSSSSRSRSTTGNSNFRNSFLTSTGSFTGFRNNNNNNQQSTRTSRFVPRSTNSVLSNSIDTTNRKPSSSSTRSNSKPFGGLKSPNGFNWPGGSGYFFRMSTGGSKPVSYFIKYDD